MSPDEDEKIMNGTPEAAQAELDEVNGDQPEVAKPPDPILQLQEQIRELRREVGERRNAPPPKEEPPPKVEEEIQWDKLLFENPKEAVAKLRSSIKEEVTNSLRDSYTQDQNTRQFWTGFFDKYPELKVDKDLVEVTLHANISSLGNLKVEDAADKLAELTRDRILRYSGKHSENGVRKKPQAEGANPPRPRGKREEPAKPITLSQIIKARRAQKTAPPPGNRGSAA